jgi:hypothetical protein
VSIAAEPASFHSKEFSMLLLFLRQLMSRFTRWPLGKGEPMLVPRWKNCTLNAADVDDPYSSLGVNVQKRRSKPLPGTSASTLIGTGCR